MKYRMSSFNLLTPSIFAVVSSLSFQAAIGMEGQTFDLEERRHGPGTLTRPLPPLFEENSDGDGDFVEVDRQVLTMSDPMRLEDVLILADIKNALGYSPQEDELAQNPTQRLAYQKYVESLMIKLMQFAGWKRSDSSFSSSYFYIDENIVSETLKREKERLLILNGRDAQKLELYIAQLEALANSLKNGKKSITSSQELPPLLPKDIERSTGWMGGGAYLTHSTNLAFLVPPNAVEDTLEIFNLLHSAFQKLQAAYAKLSLSFSTKIIDPILKSRLVSLDRDTALNAWGKLLLEVNRDYYDKNTSDSRRFLSPTPAPSEAPSRVFSSASSRMDTSRLDEKATARGLYPAASFLSSTPFSPLQEGDNDVFSALGSLSTSSPINAKIKKDDPFGAVTSEKEFDLQDFSIGSDGESVDLINSTHPNQFFSLNINSPGTNGPTPKGPEFQGVALSTALRTDMTKYTEDFSDLASLFNLHSIDPNDKSAAEFVHVSSRDASAAPSPQNTSLAESPAPSVHGQDDAAASGARVLPDKDYEDLTEFEHVDSVNPAATSSSQERSPALSIIHAIAPADTALPPVDENDLAGFQQIFSEDAGAAPSAQERSAAGSPAVSIHGADDTVAPANTALPAKDESDLAGFQQVASEDAMAVSSRERSTAGSPAFSIHDANNTATAAVAPLSSEEALRKEDDAAASGVAPSVLPAEGSGKEDDVVFVSTTDHEAANRDLSLKLAEALAVLEQFKKEADLKAKEAQVLAQQQLETERAQRLLAEQDTERERQQRLATESLLRVEDRLQTQAALELLESAVVHPIQVMLEAFQAESITPILSSLEEIKKNFSEHPEYDATPFEAIKETITRIQEAGLNTILSLMSTFKSTFPETEKLLSDPTIVLAKAHQFVEKLMEGFDRSTAALNSEPGPISEPSQPLTQHFSFGPGLGSQAGLGLSFALVPQESSLFPASRLDGSTPRLIVPLGTTSGSISVSGQSIRGGLIGAKSSTPSVGTTINVLSGKVSNLQPSMGAWKAQMNTRLQEAYKSLNNMTVARHTAAPMRRRAGDTTTGSLLVDVKA
ncbi:MAG: hypothetical protein JSS34_04325 [Proteobacteria bacterium]|nr:hypothetical protein [Pseudomonadota bacterium]